MDDKKQQQPPDQTTDQGQKRLDEERAILTGIRGGVTVTNTRPAPPNPNRDDGGKDDKK